jgi:RNA recognition motif-containing protein
MWEISRGESIARCWRTCSVSKGRWLMLGPSDRESGRSRGFGFVTYGSSEEVNNAISNLDGVVSSTLSLFCIWSTLLFCFEDVLIDCFIAMQDLDGRQI